MTDPGSIKVSAETPIKRGPKIEADSPYELIGWKLREEHVEKYLNHYFSKLDRAQVNSFAPTKQLIQSSLDGLDIQFLILMNMNDVYNERGTITSNTINSVEDLEKM